jgi:hypothetical protein
VSEEELRAELVKSQQDHRVLGDEEVARITAWQKLAVHIRESHLKNFAEGSGYYMVSLAWMETLEKLLQAAEACAGQGVLDARLPSGGRYRCQLVKQTYGCFLEVAQVLSEAETQERGLGNRAVMVPLCRVEGFSTVADGEAFMADLLGVGKSVS